MGITWEPPPVGRAIPIIPNPCEGLIVQISLKSRVLRTKSILSSLSSAGGSAEFSPQKSNNRGKAAKQDGWSGAHLMGTSVKNNNNIG